ncbi:tyrosine-type recombinase/integrase [Vagococcus entomophilus]|uniref:Site-specific integrase n=1 Tax=Vagococcus entomophilus TaxID=1160095 RepID=A0A430AH55_9ENTE|nr:site-specific integrase [Vagococcus entomophilus]RSU07276.1 site-specific integrase [Vagococcus entomophilus]
MAEYKQYSKKNGEKAWLLRAYLGSDPVTGKSIKVNRRGFNTKKEAQQELTRLQNDFDKKGQALTQNITFKELYEMWLEQQRKSVKPSTIAISVRYARNQILPAFGKLKLNKITVAYCQKIVNEWHDKYKQYAFLRKVTAQIMKYGISMEIMDSNPMKKTILPRKKEEETKINFYSKEELQEFMEIVKANNNYKHYAYFRVLAFTGMRKSELLATQWSDIDLFNKTISIGKTIAMDEHGDVVLQSPKTKNSLRSISLDDITIKILSSWRMKQREDYFKLGFNTGSEKQFVFTNINNELYYPQVVNDWLDWIYKKEDQKRLKLDPDSEKIRRITPHGFRHTHCSLLFESGANINQVQERLGHKDIKTTMNIYAHVTEKAKEETGQKFAQYVNF